VLSIPSPQNAVNVFSGEWASSFPSPFEDIKGGGSPLFEDARIAWALDQFGDLTGSNVLELGPLEGGHTYMLTNAGANVLAVEAQTRAYLKCLIAKELLGMDHAHFVLGDFMEYLRTTHDRFDVCVASGVLYHMRNPVETLALTTNVADKLFLWTHYYDEDIISNSKVLSPRFPSYETAESHGFKHKLHRHVYGAALQLKGFCGGSAPHANWLSRSDVLGALEHFGWTVGAIAFETPDHPNGPAFALAATRTPGP
jgi:hypothetical protein